MRHGRLSGAVAAGQTRVNWKRGGGPRPRVVLLSEAKLTVQPVQDPGYGPVVRLVTAVAWLGPVAMVGVAAAFVTC